MSKEKYTIQATVDKDVYEMWQQLKKAVFGQRTRLNASLLGYLVSEEYRRQGLPGEKEP